MCTPGASPGCGSASEATLATSMVVREDSLTLFGFADYEERALFELLQTASGVGPKLAQAMLAVHGPDELRRAVATEDLVALCAVPGIGRKGAQRIVLELKDRIGAPTSGSGATPVSAAGARDEAGATRCGRACSAWAGRSSEAEAAVDAVAPMAAEALSDGEPLRSPSCCAPRCGRCRGREPDGRTRSRCADLGRGVVDSEADGDERAVEAALRPAEPRRGHRPGPGPRAARPRARGGPQPRAAAPDHVLLSGPPGLGKTTMAMIIAAEIGAPLRVTSGPAIQHAGDLAAILSGLNEGDVLFLDEIHRMSRPAEEMLYLAMEDFRVDVVVGKGPGATAIPLEIPPFTLVGATTRAGLLPGPLRDRFGFTGHLEFYEADELHRIVVRSARLLEVEVDERRRPARSRRGRAARPASPTGCSGGCATTPRCGPTARSPATSPTTRWRCSRSTSPASTGSTVAVLDALCRRFGGGPVGLSTLAVAVGEERETVEEVAEPFLVRSGYLARTPRGRVATPARLGAPRSGRARGGAVRRPGLAVRVDDRLIAGVLRRRRRRFRRLLSRRLDSAFGRDSARVRMSSIRSTAPAEAGIAHATQGESTGESRGSRSAAAHLGAGAAAATSC